MKVPSARRRWIVQYFETVEVCCRCGGRVVLRIAPSWPVVVSAVTCGMALGVLSVVLGALFGWLHPRA
jgi:hypothetical protein